MSMFEQPIGTSSTYTVTLSSSTGDRLPYTSGDAVNAKLWAGDSRAGITLTSAWNTQLSNFTGTPQVCAVDVQVAAANIAALDPGIYKIRVWVGSENHHAADANLRILATPGSASPGRTYCSIEDLKKIYWNVEAFQSDEDQAGLLEIREQAREWFDEYVLAAWSKLANLSEPTEAMKTALENGKMEVDTQVRRCNAYWAMANFLTQRQLETLRQPTGQESLGAPTYKSMAKDFKAEAMKILTRISVRVDTGITSSVWVRFRLVRFV